MFMNTRIPTAQATEKAVAYYTEDNLDLERWFQVANKDYATLLAALDFDALFPKHRPQLRLLDVGCGTGRFPEMMHPLLPNHNQSIDYDFVDPSAYCLEMMPQSLLQPYKPCHALPLGAESLGDWGAQSGLRYDVIWAIHSLYFFDKQKIPLVIKTLSGLLMPETGVGLIYIFTNNSFYTDIYNAYNQVFSISTEPYLTAEQFTEAFDNAELHHQAHLLEFHHHIDGNDHLLLEKYLHKCVLDATRPLAQWWQHAPLRELLESCREGEHYRFPQAVCAIQFGNMEQSLLKK
jgi:SAM-dependent methyltransferase